MSFNWRDLPPADMEQHFNPRAAVLDTEARLADFAARSAAAREQITGRYDLRYGERPKETLDLHIPEQGGAGRALVLFIHGGFWRGLDKSDHSFVVPPLLDTGAVVANVNYDLCPTVSLDQIVEEMANAVHFCAEQARDWGADPNEMYLLGHSAGAHLAAEMLLTGGLWDRPAGWGIQGVVALSGVYEPEVILGVTVNEEAQISRETALARNCLNRDFALKPEMLVAVGEQEPLGWIEQSRHYADVCRHAGLSTRLEIVPDANHFTVLEHALTASHPLHEAVTGLWRTT